MRLASKARPHGVRSEHRQQQRQDDHRRLLDAYWELAAAMAWLNYVQQGRGALVVAPTAPQVFPDRAWAFGTMVAIYLSERTISAAADMVSANLAHVLTTMVAHYHPARDVVVIFLAPDDHIDAYRIGSAARVVPPLAYERQKDLLPRLPAAEAVAGSKTLMRWEHMHQTDWSRGGV